MKKIISVIMICIISMLLSITVLADGECRIYAKDTAATEAGSVIVSLRIENNPGNAVGKVNIKFDNTKLIPVSVSRGSVTSSAWSFTSNLDDPNSDSSEFEEITVAWMNMANLSGDGEIAVIEFAVKEGASESTDMEISVTELANANQANISAVTQNGTVSFGGTSDGDTSGIIMGFAATTVAKTDDNIGGAVNVSVYTDTGTDATFIYTIFDSQGSLMAVKTKEAQLKTGTNEVSLGELNAKAQAGGMYAVKVYMWDKISNMQPLTVEPIINRY